MAQSTPFQAPTGTRDVMGPESARWEALLARFAATVEAAGFELLVSPMFEDVAVFSRGMGESSDVVSKEMYELEDKGGRHLALRPEGTASVVRAFVQHRPPAVWKAWYATPAFRYERPQAGRLRQHHQVGVEALGSPDPDLDAEVVALSWRFLASLGLRRLGLRVGSMGDAACRPAYAVELRRFLARRAGALCPEHSARWEANPLRVLDCKRDACREATGVAPRLVDALCPECAKHFARLREGLDALGVGHEVDGRLVRGFDYYTRTTFEIEATSIASAQDVVSAGGRYDGLVEQLGGPPTPGVGFGMGVERVLLACDAEDAFAVPGLAPQVFVVDLTGGLEALALVHELRAAGVPAARAYDDRSLKAQLRAADRSGADLAAIVGPDEVAAGTVTLRRLRGGGGQGEEAQEVVARAGLAGKVLAGGG